MDRRAFLGHTALAAAGLVASSRIARALQLEQPAQALANEYHAARAACSPASNDHAAMLADLRTLLGDQRLTEADRAALMAHTTCPLCGCRISEE